MHVYKLISSFFCINVLYEGVFSDVLNYVLRIGKNNNLKLMHPVGEEIKSRPVATTTSRLRAVHFEDEDNVDVEAVCVECFRFLKALAKEYLEVQSRLSNANLGIDIVLLHAKILI